MQQSHQAITNSFNTPTFPPADQSLLLTPPELMKNKFDENRAKFQFDGGIPEFLYIPNLEHLEEECTLPSHRGLKPRILQEDYAKASSDASSASKRLKQIVSKVGDSSPKSLDHIDNNSSKQSTAMNKSSKPFQMCARSA